MPVTDSIADLLTRIRNACKANHSSVEVPYSKLKMAIAEILKEQGYISDCLFLPGDIQGSIKMTLRYYNKQPAIRNITRISKPGRRVYTPVDRLPRVKNGLGIAIISTSKGVMTDKKARQYNIGGEVLCSIW